MQLGAHAPIPVPPAVAPAPAPASAPPIRERARDADTSGVQMRVWTYPFLLAYAVLMCLVFVATFTAMPMYIARCLRWRIGTSFAVVIGLSLIHSVAYAAGHIGLIHPVVHLVILHISLLIIAFAGYQQIRGRCRVRNVINSGSRFNLRYLNLKDLR